MDLYELAHKAYRRIRSCRFDPEGYRCHRCGKDLKTVYLEERLYAVRCDTCDTITLVKAKSPAEAESVVGE